MMSQLAELKRPGKYIRVDFTSEFTHLDDDTHTFQAILRPDPRRYKEISKRGKTYYRDRYLGYQFDLEDLANMASETPIYYSPANIKNSIDYANLRASAIQKEVAGGEYEPPTELPDAHHDLSGTGSADFTFLSLDIVNSTKTRVKYSSKYDEVVEILFREMGTMVGHFHATIFKPTGDGFICYLDHPSVNCQSDNAVDLGDSLLRVLRGVNNAMPEGYPKLSVRIGAERGRAEVKRLVIPLTGFDRPDILSDALNRAVKIQEKAPTNTFVIGQMLYESIHVQWLQRTSRTRFRIDVGLKGYKTYVVH